MLVRRRAGNPPSTSLRLWGRGSLWEPSPNGCQMVKTTGKQGRAQIRRSAPGLLGGLSGIAPELAALAHVNVRFKAVVVHGDPLHIAGLVQPSGAEGTDVVNLPAGTGSREPAGGGAGVL